MVGGAPRHPGPGHDVRQRGGGVSPLREHRQRRLEQRDPGRLGLAAAAIVRASAPTDTSNDLIGLANTSPHQAVHAAFNQLVDDLGAIAAQIGMEPLSDPAVLARALADRGAIDPQTPAQVDTLRDLVALAAFDPGRLDSAEALRFVTYAQVARNALRRSKTPPSS